MNTPHKKPGYAAVTENPLFSMFNPKSIAFFGASNRFSSMGTNQLSSILQLEYPGRIYPIHPKETRVLGHKAYPDIQNLPETPDLAILVLPTQLVADMMLQCGRKGVKNAIVVSGGFKEVGSEGAVMEKTLLRIARRYGMRFLGPNCLGIANPYHKLNTTFLPFQGHPGFIGMASQSGSFITQMFGYLSQMGLGFSTAVSVGNEADIDIVDCMEYLAVCPHTKVICLYIEGIRRGRRFMETARAIIHRKPIVAYYVGGSESGKRASMSHTGALSGPDTLYDGVFKQSGVIRAGSIEEMFDICSILGTAPMPAGNRVIIQTHSGGPGAAAADACNREGLQTPLIPQALCDKVAPFVPHTGSLSNPLDITFSKNHLDYFHDLPALLLQDDAYDILLFYLLLPTRLFRGTLQSAGIPLDQIEIETAKIMNAICDMIAGLPRTFQKPVVGYSFHSNDEPIITGLRQRGLPVFPCPHRAARAMAALAQYAAKRRGTLIGPMMKDPE